MRNWKYTALVGALAVLAAGACSPDEYPTEPRFEIEEEPEPTGHLFVYNVLPDVAVTAVTVPGAFPDAEWNPESHSMQNTWMVTVDLPAGEHEYKYVFNDGGWAGNMCDESTWGDPANNNYVDPNGEGCVDGGENALITVDEAGPHTFMYIVPEGVPEITQLHVAGSFQGWDPGATPMRETYALWMDLEPGSYEYKFHFNGADWAGDMCNDQTWGDPDNDFWVDANGQGCVEGGGNALLVVN